jgi:uncharacterized protein (UPF0335 family)
MTDVGGISSGQLRSFIDRIERLEEEKSTIAEQIRDVYGEAKGYGYDVKVIRKVIGLRKMEPNDRHEQEELLDVYMHALGMIPASDSEEEKAVA